MMKLELVAAEASRVKREEKIRKSLVFAATAAEKAARSAGRAEMWGRGVALTALEAEQETWAASRAIRDIVASEKER